MESRFECSSSGVFEIPGEPAVIINGLPQRPSPDTNVNPCDVNDAESQKFTGFGEWLVGREVRKLFGEQYFNGKVTQFDKEDKWYKVAYEDGDTEDLEWQELEKVLTPIDVNIPLKSLATKIIKRHKSAQQSARRMVRARKNVASSGKGKERECNGSSTVE